MQKGKIHAFIGIQPNLICKQKKENKDLSQSAGGERERERERERESTWTSEQNTEARGRQAGGAAVLEERDSDARSVGTSIVGHIHLEHLRPPPSGKTRFHADICDSHEAGQR